MMFRISTRLPVKTIKNFSPGILQHGIRCERRLALNKVVSDHTLNLYYKPDIQTRCYYKVSHPHFYAGNKDPYQILGVDKKATKEEIRKKFLEKAKKYHPDVNKSSDAKEKFSELNQAYQILSDENKRNIYDQTGSVEDVEQSGDHGNAEEIFNHFFGKGGPFSEFSKFSDFHEHFQGFAGPDFDEDSRKKKVEVRKGMNAQQKIVVDLKTAVYGGKVEISVNAPTKCKSCEGSGKIKGRSTEPCQTCGGKGVKSGRRGFFTLTQTCSACGGTGLHTPPCQPCLGKGFIRQMKLFDLKIPAGITDGHMLRMRGLGELGSAGADPGDLIVTVCVAPDPNFKKPDVNSNYIEGTLVVTLFQALLGGRVRATLLDGSVEIVSVKPGIQSGEYLSIRQTGMKMEHRMFYKIMLPKTLNETQKQLVRELAKSLGDTSAQ